MLRGQRRDKVVKFDHDQLSTFGIGGEFSDVQWRSIFRQLVVRGYLFSDPTRYGALRLTPMSRSLLRGDEELFLREDAQAKKVRRRKSDLDMSIEIEDEGLLEALRELRKRLAEEQGVPPYVVFHDSSLKDMILLRPKSSADLLEVSGVGQAKLSRYGDAFLQVLRDWDEAAQSPS